MGRLAEVLRRLLAMRTEKLRRVVERLSEEHEQPEPNDAGPAQERAGDDG